MTASQFNIQKEIHTNEVNKLLQSVKLNKFPKDAKIQTIELGIQVIETINAMRNEISEQLYGTKKEHEAYDHEENHNEKRAVILQEKQPIHKMRIGMVSDLNEMIEKTEKTNQDIITGPDFKRFDKTVSYKENETLLVELLKDLKVAVMIDSEEEETKPSEEDLSEEKVEEPVIETPKEELPVDKTEEQLQKEFEEELAKEKKSNEEKPKDPTFLDKILGKK